MRCLHSLTTKPLLIAVALLLLTASLVFAAYRATFTVSENGTAAYDMLSVNVTSNNLWMSDNGFMNSTANDTAVETLGGVVQPHMVTDNMTFAAIPVPLNSQTNLYFTTGNTPTETMHIIPGYGGSIDTADASNLEWGDNASVSVTGWFPTDNGADKNIFSKGNNIRTFVSPTVSGNITATVLGVETFTSDNWTDVGTPRIQVNTGAERLDYDSRREAIDQRCWIDVTTISDTEWVMSFTWHTTSHTNDGLFTFGAWETNGTNRRSYGDDLIGIEIGDSLVKIVVEDEGNITASATINFAYATTYYVTLERNTAILSTLSVYTDEARTTHLAGSPKTRSVPATVVGLQYLQGSNYDSAVGADNDVGWITTLIFPGLADDTSVTATGVASGKHTVNVTAENYGSSANLSIYIDGVLEDTTALSANITDNANDWAWMQNVMPYADNITMSVNGTQQLLYNPNAIILGTVLPDRGSDATDNPGEFTWGGNPSGVSVSLGSMISTAQPGVGATAATPARDIMPEVEVGDWFEEPDVGGTLLTNPLRPLITIVSDNTTLTELQTWRWLGLAFVLLVLGITIKAIPKHLAIACIGAGVANVILVVATIWPLWTLLFLVLYTLGAWVAERSPSV